MFPQRGEGRKNNAIIYEAVLWLRSGVAATSCLAVNRPGSIPKSVTANGMRVEADRVAIESPRNNFELKMKNQEHAIVAWPIPSRACHLGDTGKRMTKRKVWTTPLLGERQWKCWKSLERKILVCHCYLAKTVTIIMGTSPRVYLNDKHNDRHIV